MEKLNGLDLFSGIGGIGLALGEWVRTVAYCEQDRYAQGVLLSRMQSGDIDKAPIWDDVRTLNWKMLPEIDIIFGGFPCQDISVAGSGKGLAGERSGLFFEIARLVGELRPKFIFLENVPAIADRGLEQVTMELTNLGYDSRWTTLPAAEVGAPHLRKRWFLVAHSNSERFSWGSNSGSSTKSWPRPRKQLERLLQTNFWNDNPMPDINGMGNGISNRLDRVRCLGNSVVPLQVEAAFNKLIGLNPLERTTK